jgi:AmmeMemoRadiSam system protein B
VPIDRGALGDADRRAEPGSSGPTPGSRPVAIDDRVHEREHAIEVQLPFLQEVLGDFTLVPIAVGEAESAEVAEVIEGLWGGDETLVVISTDLSHYLPYEKARAVDAATVQRVLALDGTLGHEQACGATPLNAALAVSARHGLQARLLDLRNSGDTAGDRTRVVGYAAFVFT